MGAIKAGCARIERALAEREARMERCIIIRSIRSHGRVFDIIRTKSGFESVVERADINRPTTEIKTHKITVEDIY